MDYRMDVCRISKGEHIEHLGVRAQEMLRRVVVLLFLALSAIATTFEHCPNMEKPPLKFRAANCTQYLCYFVRGKNATVQVDFVPDHEITSMQSKAYAFVLDAPLEIMEQSHACESLVNQVCPLPKDESATYLFKLPIPSIFAPIMVTLQLSLIDSVTGKIIMCFQIECKFV
ncbi:NPC intracellular cholesterol transporter 2-like isoform X2 [Periplaneta americana]|uniref:NPC intracellular cholesterol transporter 2-like isoform X2 n=1 Tax=Periplaneta americana TaxID=6978 RepID=UPI0037E899ED